MQELEELRAKIEQQDYVGALRIVDELEEMSRDDKLNKIYSYCIILLLHLIKQSAEERTTSSWGRSIANSVDGINRTNKRRSRPCVAAGRKGMLDSRSGGCYATDRLLQELLEEAYPKALREAAYEAFEGKLSAIELEAKIERDRIIGEAVLLLGKN